MEAPSMSSVNKVTWIAPPKITGDDAHPIQVGMSDLATSKPKTNAKGTAGTNSGSESSAPLNKGPFLLEFIMIQIKLYFKSKSIVKNLTLEFKGL